MKSTLLLTVALAVFGLLAQGCLLGNV